MGILALHAFIHVPFVFNLPERKLKSEFKPAFQRDKQGPQQRTEVVKNKATRATKSAGHVAEAV